MKQQINKRYMAIYEDIKEKILSGEFGPGHKLS